MILKENEWNTINNILLDMYEIGDVDILTERVLKTFRMLVPYTQGYYLVFDEKENICKKHSSFIFLDEESASLYMEHYYQIDYIKYVFDFTRKTITYRDTDILQEDIRRKTVFYREFLNPKNIPYGCGIILMKEEKVIGIVNLFRSSELGDFTDKDMYILDTLKLHLRNIHYHLLVSQEEEKENKIVTLCNEYNISEREKEVMELANRGYSNEAIGRELSVAPSTIKKHFYSIYNKMGIRNRVELMVRLK